MQVLARKDGSGAVDSCVNQRSTTSSPPRGVNPLARFAYNLNLWFSVHCSGFDGWFYVPLSGPSLGSTSNIAVSSRFYVQCRNLSDCTELLHIPPHTNTYLNPTTATSTSVLVAPCFSYNPAQTSQLTFAAVSSKEVCPTISQQVSVPQRWFAPQKIALVERVQISLVLSYLDTNCAYDGAKTPSTPVPVSSTLDNPGNSTKPLELFLPSCLLQYRSVCPQSQHIQLSAVLMRLLNCFDFFDKIFFPTFPPFYNILWVPSGHLHHIITILIIHLHFNKGPSVGLLWASSL